MCRQNNGNAQAELKNPSNIWCATKRLLQGPFGRNWQPPKIHPVLRFKEICRVEIASQEGRQSLSVQMTQIRCPLFYMILSNRGADPEGQYFFCLCFFFHRSPSGQRDAPAIGVRKKLGISVLSEKVCALLPAFMKSIFHTCWITPV